MTGSEDWVRTTPADAEGESLVLKPMAVRPGRVPNVQGLTLRDALFLLENRNLRVRVLGTGRVKWQSVAAGATAQRGSTVVLQLEPIGGRPTAPVVVALPDASSDTENRTPRSANARPAARTVPPAATPKPLSAAKRTTAVVKPKAKPRA